MPSQFSTQLLSIIQNDKWMLNILAIIRDLNLNDCWIGAGFVRNKIWDVKHDKVRTKLNDIDVIYYDNANKEKAFDSALENKLNAIIPDINWSVKNQARMHLRAGHKQYSNCNESISFWPETATAIAIKLNDKNQLEYIALHGLSDLFNLKVKPTPGFDLKIYKDRINKKKWQIHWTKLSFEMV